jgi:hypothetical protein
MNLQEWKRWWLNIAEWAFWWTIGMAFIFIMTAWEALSVWRARRKLRWLKKRNYLDNKVCIRGLEDSRTSRSSRSLRWLPRSRGSEPRRRHHHGP